MSHNNSPDHENAVSRLAASTLQRLAAWVRLRATLLALLADRLTTLLFASAVSFIGAEAVIGLLGVTVSFPIGFPMVIVGLALSAAVHTVASRVRRLVRGRTRR